MQSAAECPKIANMRRLAVIILAGMQKFRFEHLRLGFVFEE
jgi:hypothetical protein